MSAPTKTTPFASGTNQTSTYMAGIFGASTSSGQPVYIDSTGHLGTGGGAGGGGGVTSFNGRSGAVTVGERRLQLHSAERNLWLPVS